MERFGTGMLFFFILDTILCVMGIKSGVPVWICVEVFLGVLLSAFILLGQYI